MVRAIATLAALGVRALSLGRDSDVDEHGGALVLTACPRLMPCTGGLLASIFCFFLLVVSPATHGAYIRHPELKLSAPAHTKHLGWHLEFEFRVTTGPAEMDQVGVLEENTH